jgi:hypothetical protein
MTLTLLAWGIVSDRIGERLSIAIGLTGAAAALVVAANVNGFVPLVAALVATGVGAEIGRYAFPPALALAVYVTHLGMVLSLFLTFPFSKFAHALYRTLAMAHERLVAAQRRSS